MRALIVPPLLALTVAAGASAQSGIGALALALPPSAVDSLAGASRLAPRPDPRYSPEQVIGFQLSALRDNDVPAPNAGIATAFAFASPANREAMGPLDRFVELVKSPSYRPLVHHLRAERGPLRVDGNEAEQQVTVIGLTGERVSYLFTLTRQPQGAPCAGCWMTDGVMRLRAFDPPVMVQRLALLDRRAP